MLYPLLSPLFLLLLALSFLLRPASYICLFFPERLYSFSDPSHEPTPFVLIASAPKIELSFPPPHMPFLSPYFKISAPV